VKKTLFRKGNCDLNEKKNRAISGIPGTHISFLNDLGSPDNIFGAELLFSSTKQW